MGFEDEAEQSNGRPSDEWQVQRPNELTSSIVPRGTSFHHSVELEFPHIAFDPVRPSCRYDARALISMVARSMSSNQRPDTLMQDRSPPARQKLLQRSVAPYIRANCYRLVESARCPHGASSKSICGGQIALLEDVDDILADLQRLYTCDFFNRIGHKQTSSWFPSTY